MDNDLHLSRFKNRIDNWLDLHVDLWSINRINILIREYNDIPDGDEGTPYREYWMEKDPKQYKKVRDLAENQPVTRFGRMVNAVWR